LPGRSCRPFKTARRIRLPSRGTPTATAKIRRGELIIQAASIMQGTVRIERGERSPWRGLAPWVRYRQVAPWRPPVIVYDAAEGAAARRVPRSATGSPGVAQSQRRTPVTATGGGRRLRLARAACVMSGSGNWPSRRPVRRLRRSLRRRVLAHEQPPRVTDRDRAGSAPGRLVGLHFFQPRES